MLLRIVSILFPLFSLTALGYFVGKRMRPDLSHANKLNMDVFVPALVFAALANKEFRTADFGALGVATLIVVIGSVFPGGLLARPAGVAPTTFVPPLMVNYCCNPGLSL